MFGKVYGRFFLEQHLGIAGDDDIDKVTISELIETFQMWPQWVHQFPSKKVQLFTMFETSDVHPDIINCMKVFDKVIVPFPFLKDILVNKGINCVSIDYYTSDILRDRPPVVERTPDPNAIIFLYIGTNDERKNLRKLCKLCADIFTGTRHKLIVKTNNIIGLPISDNVNIITDKISNGSIANLYNSCDYVITFSRGEGVGLPMIEGDYFNKPVIAHLGGVNKNVREFINVPWYELPCKQIPVDLTNVPIFLHKVFYGDWWDVDETAAKNVIMKCINLCN